MVDRRQFLRASAAASGLLAAPAVVSGRHLNSRLQFAAIGCDGQGWSDLHAVASHDRVRPVGFCDVDRERTANVRQLQPDVPVFQDFRQMLDDLGEHVDAVTVAVPDHMHARITLDAMARGKHVYCEKPLTHTIWEARQVRQAAGRHGVITRMGNQIHSHTAYRTAVRLIQAGVIGKVHRVHSWVADPGHGKSFHIDRPPASDPPATLDWDLWIGVAPLRPYAPGRVYHPWGWRDWQDFGNGALGDFGCHILDPIFTALEINQAPLDVRADHTGMNDEVWPAQNTVEYTFPGTTWTSDDRLPLTWYDGGRLPRERGPHLPDSTALPRSGSLLIGQEGSLVLPHFAQPRLYPEERYASYPVKAAENLNHYHGWVEGCLSGQQPSDGFDYAGRLTEAVLLGNIAVRFRGQRLTWDSESMRVTNLNEANAWVTRQYRSGWGLELVA
jgi:predicted dehydrogenase